MNRELLVNKLREAQRGLKRAAKGLEGSTTLAPDWTVQDVYAHIAAWDEVSAQSLRLLAEGKEPQVTVPQGIDTFNTEVVASYREMSFEQVIQTYERLRGELITAIVELPAVYFEKTFTFPWGPEGTIAEIVDILVHHDQEHIDEISVLHKE